MRLICASIENFGILQNQKITFHNGCNVFHHENGWGKSTLAAFLKVMLYGFDNERSRDDYTNERKRFRPWQGGIYGGSLTFEANGKVYTVTRSFGFKEREDQFILREEATNLESTDFSSALGEELFRLDRGSFERTVFLAQNECETKTTDRIHGKLGNLAEAADDVNCYEQADARLNDLLNAMSPVRKTGSLYRMKEQIAELKLEVRKGENLEKETEKHILEKTELEETYHKLKKEQEKLLIYQKRASLQKDIQAKQERYHILKEQLWKREQAMEKAGRFFSEEIPAKEELDERINQSISLTAKKNQMDVYSLTEEEQDKYQKLESQFCDKTLEIAPLEHRSEQTTAGKQKKMLVHHPWPTIFMCVGLLTVLTGAVFLYRAISEGILLLAAGAAIGIVGLIQNQKHSFSKEYEKMKQANFRYEWENTFSEYLKLKEKKEQYEEAALSYKKEREVVERYVIRLGFQPETNLQKQLLSLKTRLDEYEASVTEVEKAQKDLDLFETSQNMEQIRQADSWQKQISLEEIQEQLRNIQIELESCHQNIIHMDRQIEDNFRMGETYTKKEEQLNSLKEKYLEDSVKYERLKMTRTYLAQAKAAFTAKYRHPLMKSFSRYYEMISGERADSIRLDSNMELTIQEYGNQRESRYYSAGWKDLMGICMRLSLVDAMFKQEKPFLVLDDPFVNLDQEKTKAGLEFLKEIGEEYQILYFTCHESRRI